MDRNTVLTIQFCTLEKCQPNFDFSISLVLAQDWAFWGEGMHFKSSEAGVLKDLNQLYNICFSGMLQ